MMRERPDLANRTISRNIRLHRLARKMTQVELGAALGISFQQVQKYETGRNRVSSSRLLRIAHILNVDVLTLLGGAEGFASGGPELVELIAEPQALKLATIFASIEDSELRRAVVAVAAGVARIEERGRRVAAHSVSARAGASGNSGTNCKA